MKTVRKLVVIDEEKCDGCGDCVPSCEEGAIQIIDGKAKLVSEIYCDGLGDCLGVCPLDAITVEEVEADEFDEVAVEKHLKELKQEPAKPEPEPMVGGCPGARAMMLEPKEETKTSGSTEPVASQLANWPVQLSLVPIEAPYFNNAKIVIAADCIPFAYPDFHRRFLSGRALIIGCPKLDDGVAYVEKLSQIFSKNEIQELEVVHMEVPCCYGLVQIVKDALAKAGKPIPVKYTEVGIRGDEQRSVEG